MYDYLIHSDNGLDGPVLVDGADTLAEARIIARREMERDPQRTVTIVDRFDCAHQVNAGRPPKADGDKHVRVTITLPPETLAKLDAMGEGRSAAIDRLIREHG